MKFAISLLTVLAAANTLPSTNLEITDAPPSLIPRAEHPGVCDESTFSGDTAKTSLPDIKDCQNMLPVLQNSWMGNLGWDLFPYSKDTLLYGRCNFTAHTVSGSGFLGTKDAIYLVNTSIALMKEKGYVNVRGIMECKGVYVGWSLIPGLLSRPRDS